MTFPSQASILHIVQTLATQAPDHSLNAQRLQTQLEHFRPGKLEEKNRPEQLAKMMEDEFAGQGEGFKGPSGVTNLVNLLYAEVPPIQQAREQIFGKMNRDEFVQQLKKSQKANFQELMSVAETYSNKSFPETFFHPGIATLLVTTNRMDTGKGMRKRIEHTGLMVAGALLKKFSMSAMMAIANVHHSFSREWYTQDAVHFTLLTFSVYGFRAAGKPDTEWYFYWRVFGSCMGLPPEALASNYAQAKEQFARIRANLTGDPARLSPHSKKLLETFVGEFLRDEQEVRLFAGEGHVSKLMYQYLTGIGRWPQGLGRGGSADD